MHDSLMAQTLRGLPGSLITTRPLASTRLASLLPARSGRGRPLNPRAARTRAFSGEEEAKVLALEAQVRSRPRSGAKSALGGQLAQRPAFGPEALCLKHCLRHPS